MTDEQPTQPLTDAELLQIKERTAHAVNIDEMQESDADNVFDLIDTVHRLRAALTALGRNERVAANRSLELQEENSTLLRKLEEQYRIRAENARLRTENAAQAEQLAAGDASDGYHTHNELYEYRMLYNAHAAIGWLDAGYRVVKSWTHSDGELCFGGGWFVVVAELPTGQVTNHYEADHWELFVIPEETPPAYDGHSPADAAHRLRQALGWGGDPVDS